MCWVDPFALVFFRGAEKRLKAAKALKEKGETPEELLRSIKENEKAEAESDKEEAEKQMDDEEPKPVGSGVFGNIYNQNFREGGKKNSRQKLDFDGL